MSCLKLGYQWFYSNIKFQLSDKILVGIALNFSVFTTLEKAIKKQWSMPVTSDLLPPPLHIYNTDLWEEGAGGSEVSQHCCFDGWAHDVQWPLCISYSGVLEWMVFISAKLLIL